MNRPDTVAGRRASGFFRKPEAWVLMAAAADGATIAASNRTASGSMAMRCFLSPIDAMIGAAGLAQRDERHVVLAAADLPPAAFLERGSAHYHASLHMAWSAHNGRVLLHADGTPAERYILLRQPLRDGGIFGGKRLCTRGTGSSVSARRAVRVEGNAGGRVPVGPVTTGGYL